MKTIKVAIIALFVFAIGAQAQDKAIGLRFGGGSVNGVEISYQMPIGGETNRLQLDLGFGSNSTLFHTGLTGTYQWMFDIASVEGLQWYAGAGAALGFYSYDNEGLDDSGLTFAIGGIVGIEYTLSAAPIQFALDTRPMFNLAGRDYYSNGWSSALSVRYVF